MDIYCLHINMLQETQDVLTLLISYQIMGSQIFQIADLPIDQNDKTKNNI